MRTKSFPVRSSRKSLDPASRNRIEKLEEIFGCEEIVSDTCDVPHKKRHCVGTSETGKGGSEFDACIVCGISDMLVSRCSGIDCLISFHGECLTADFGGSEDLANPFCPYCWFKFVALKSKSLRDKAIDAEKAVFKYLDKDMKSRDQVLQGEKAAYYSSKEEQVQIDKDSGKSNMPLTDQPKEGTGNSGDMKKDEVEASEDQERVNIENFQDAEDDDETAESGAVESYSGKEHDQVQQNEKQRRRRRIELNDTDSENSSTKERNGEDVTEQITSSPSGMMKNQQRKLSEATTKVAAAKSKTPRDVSFFNKDQRRRLLWTSEEEEMLKVGVEKFAAEANKNMPWRKILKMGETVFHQTRTSADLKDKWRNMIKSPH